MMKYSTAPRHEGARKESCHSCRCTDRHGLLWPPLEHQNPDKTAELPKILMRTWANALRKIVDGPAARKIKLTQEQLCKEAELTNGRQMLHIIAEMSVVADSDKTIITLSALIHCRYRTNLA